MLNSHLLNVFATLPAAGRRNAKQGLQKLEET
jgi:hypothetical protein